MSQFSFSTLEPDQAPLLIEAIQEILAEADSHNASRFDLEYWRWLYERLPGGEATVFLAWHEGKIVGYYHVPVYAGSYAGKPCKLANIQDVAVNSSFRGQGLFRQLATYANDQIDCSDVDLIYTFPNERSIGTFQRYNDFITLTALGTYVLPIRAGQIADGKLPVGEKLGNLDQKPFNALLRFGARASIEVSDSCSDPTARIFERYGMGFAMHLRRTREWLNWRYRDCPRGRHWFVTAGSSTGSPQAAAVFTLEQIFGSPALVLLDLAYEEGCELELLALLREIARDPRGRLGVDANLIFYAGQTPFNSQLKRVGFVRIPKRANPRVLNLLVRDAGAVGGLDHLSRDQVLVTLGDWDVF